MLSRKSTLVKRHKNPIGVFGRAIIYPTIALGLWQHSWVLILIGTVTEIAIWTVLPPVDATPGIIEQSVDLELAWLNSPAGKLKTLSFLLLGLFPTLLCVGLWRHWPAPLYLAGLSLMGFYCLMRRLARGVASKR